MTFSDVVMTCFKDRELVTQFDRLWGTSLMLGGVNGEVDIASGKRKDDMLAFILFVKTCIWDRLPAEAFA